MQVLYENHDKSEIAHLLQTKGATAPATPARRATIAKTCGGRMRDQQQTKPRYRPKMRLKSKLINLSVLLLLSIELNSNKLILFAIDRSGFDMMITMRKPIFTIKGGSRRAEKSRKVLMMMLAAKM